MRTKSVLVVLSLLGLAACSNELKVTELEPATGTYMGGEEVTIHGNGFPQGRGVQVRFGKHEAANVVIASPTKLKVTTPAGDKGSAVDVSIMFDDGRAFLLKSSFKYVDAAGSQRSAFDKTFNKMGDDPKKDGTAPSTPAPAPAPAPEKK